MNDTFSLARNTRGIAQHDAEPQIDMRRMRAWRLGRIQGELRRLDLGGIILYDPVNIRYATGTSNMQVWFTHNPIRYCFVPCLRARPSSSTTRSRCISTGTWRP